MSSNNNNNNNKPTKKRFEKQKQRTAAADSSLDNSFGDQSLNLNDVFTQVTTSSTSSPPPPPSAPPAPPSAPPAPSTTTSSTSTTPRVPRPNAKPRMTKYEKALSARQLPTAPPPPTSGPTGLQRAQSVRGIGMNTMGMGMNTMNAPAPVAFGGPPPPPPKSKPTMAQRSASQRHFQIDALGSSAAELQSPTQNKSVNMNMNVSSTNTTSKKNQEPVIHVLAEGVPLTADQETAMADESQRKDKDKKAKKKKQDKVETFDDEMEDLSASEHHEELSAEEKAELKEQQVKKTLCFALLSAVGLVAAFKFIAWIMQKMSSQDDIPTGEDDIVNAATNTGTAGATNQAAVNTAVVQQMGVAASQSAAASSAAGTATAATAATAAAATATTTAATGVTAASVTGVAGYVAYTALIANPHPCETFMDVMSPHTGYMRLQMQGNSIPSTFLDYQGNKSILESLFVDAYNEQLGSCVEYSQFIELNNDTQVDANMTFSDDLPDDPNMYARFMQNATIESWQFIDMSSSGNGISYVEMNWTAVVGCDDTDGPGCSDIEPLFYNGDMPTGTNANIARRLGAWFNPLQEDNTAAETSNSNNNNNRRLQNKKRAGLDTFLSAFTTVLKDVMPSVTVNYGAALATNGTNMALEESGNVRNDGSNPAAATPAGGKPEEESKGELVCQRGNGVVIEVASKQGNVQTDFEGFENDSFWTDYQAEIKELFIAVYNDITGACDGEFYRVLKSVDMIDFDVDQEQNPVLTSINWTATLTCAGCSDNEPLFFSDAAKTEKNDESRRQLAIDSATLLANFANALEGKLSELYLEKVQPDAQIKVYYAAVFDVEDKIDQFAGEKIPFTIVEDDTCDNLERPAGDLQALPTGRFEVFISHILPEVNQDILAKIMQDVYNEEAGCDDQYQRVVHQLSIGSIDHGVKNDVLPYINVTATAKIKCTGCGDNDEPLFFLGTEEDEDLLFLSFQASLTETLKRVLADFESSTYAEGGATFYPASNILASNDKDVEVFHGITFDKDGQVFREVGEGVGTPAPITEKLLAGDDEIVPVDDCSTHLITAGDREGHFLNIDQYFVFVDSMFGEVFPGQEWPTEIRNYDELPDEVMDVFHLFAEGGLLEFGQPDDGQTFTGDKLVHVEAICYYVSHAVRDNMSSLTAVPETAAPTEEDAPTAAPTSAAPSQAPSEAPTETRIVTIYAFWKFGLRGDVRDAEQEELDDFADVTSEWMTTEMSGYYSNDTIDYDFVSQDLTIFDTEFLPAQTDEKKYNLGIITQSDFIFLGLQPSAEEVFDVLDTFDLKGFVEGTLWINDGAVTDKWIFDQIETFVLASANVNATRL